MIAATVTLQNSVGLHARPAATFVQTANRFVSRITVEKDSAEADAKSILDVLSLGAEQGSSLTIKVDGDDEALAMKTLVDLVNSKFGEE